MSHNQYSDEKISVVCNFSIFKPLTSKKCLFIIYQNQNWLCDEWLCQILSFSVPLLLSEIRAPQINLILVLKWFKFNNISVDQVREPPTITGKFGPWSSDFFNLSMTYRRNAEIDNGWARIVPIDDNNVTSLRRNKSSQNREVFLHLVQNCISTKMAILVV